MANKKLHSCVEKLKQKGKDTGSAYAICNASLSKVKKTVKGK